MRVRWDVKFVARAIGWLSPLVVMASGCAAPRLPSFTSVSGATTGGAVGSAKASAAASTATVATASYNESPYDARRAQIEEMYRDDGEPVRRKKPTGFDALAPASVKAGIKQLTGYGPNPQVARNLMADAEAIYERALAAQGEERLQLLGEASAKYAEAADRWPESALEEDALFMAGEAAFFSDHYPKAEEYYARLIKHHTNSRYMETVDLRRFAIARYWLDVDRAAPQPFYLVNLTNPARPWYDTDGHAFRVFDRIRNDDPTGKLADDATIAAANAHFQSGDYQKADDLYADLRKAFPSSEHQFEAHFLGLKTKLLTYQGWDYSSEPLDQAENLVKQTRRQFPQQAEKEKEFLARAAAEVHFKKAERLWSLGRYYELKREYRAATICFNQLQQDYADTPFAKDAASRIPNFVGKPPSPPQPVPWLANLFPARSTAKPLFHSDDAPVNSSKRR
jgi:outer membrane protein assembly factor BamD (BamD/ComL family)